jgi:hypothetical protein
LRIACQATQRSPGEEPVNLAILALIFGPSIVVFLAGCIVALYRTFVTERRLVARSPQRRRAV